MASAVTVCVYSDTQSCPTLCNPVAYSPPGSSVHAIFLARILEWVAIPFSRRSSQTKVSCITGRFFTSQATREAHIINQFINCDKWIILMLRWNGGNGWGGMLVAQPCPTLFDPMDCGPPGSSVHGILLARILEWVAIPFSRGSSPREWTQVFYITGRCFHVWATNGWGVYENCNILFFYKITLMA